MTRQARHSVLIYTQDAFGEAHPASEAVDRPNGGSRLLASAKALATVTGFCEDDSQLVRGWGQAGKALDTDLAPRIRHPQPAWAPQHRQAVPRSGPASLKPSQP